MRGQLAAALDPMPGSTCHAAGAAISAGVSGLVNQRDERGFVNPYKPDDLDKLAGAAQDHLDAQAQRLQVRPPRTSMMQWLPLVLTSTTWCAAVLVWGFYLFNHYASDDRIAGALDDLLAEADARIAAYVHAYGTLPRHISDPSLASVVTFKSRNTQASPPEYVLEARMDGVSRTLGHMARKHDSP